MNHQKCHNSKCEPQTPTLTLPFRVATWTSIGLPAPLEESPHRIIEWGRLEGTLKPNHSNLALGWLLSTSSGCPGPIQSGLRHLQDGPPTALWAYYASRRTTTTKIPYNKIPHPRSMDCFHQSIKAKEQLALEQYSASSRAETSIGFDKVHVKLPTSPKAATCSN